VNHYKNVFSLNKSPC